MPKEQENLDAAKKADVEETNTTEKTAEKAADTTTEKNAAKPDSQADNKPKQDDSLLAEVMDKKEKLRKAQAEKDALEQKLREYGDIDPVKVREMLKRERDAAQKEAEARGDFENARKMMAEEHQSIVKSRDEEIENLKKELSQRDQQIDGLTLGSSFANSGFIKDNLILTPSKARALYGSHFEVKDGQVVAYNKPAGVPDRTQLVDASGEPYSFDAAFQKIIEQDPDRDTLLRSKVKEGSGSRTDNIPTGDKNTGQELFGASRILAGLKATKPR